MLDWNPHGHPPAHIYDKPHFDLHFYMTPETEVMRYMDSTKMMINPAADYLPANYIGANPVPMMGKHWMDATSGELRGQPFTQTFLYGSYNGQVVFYEPMVTLDFLKNTQISNVPFRSRLNSRRRDTIQQNCTSLLMTTEQISYWKALPIGMLLKFKKLT